MSVLDLCSYLGLAATGFATLTLWLGLLIALRYSPQRFWPHRHFNLFALHQWSAYATVVFALTHPVVLLFQHTPRFRVLDLVWPLHSPLQPKLNCAGAGALYLLLVLLGLPCFATGWDDHCGASCTRWRFLLSCLCSCTAFLPTRC